MTSTLPAFTVEMMISGACSTMLLTIFLASSGFGSRTVIFMIWVESTASIETFSANTSYFRFSPRSSMVLPSTVSLLRITA